MFCCLQAVVWTQIAAWKWNQSLILKWVYLSRDNKHQCLFLCLQIGTEGNSKWPEQLQNFDTFTQRLRTTRHLFSIQLLWKPEILNVEDKQTKFERSNDHWHERNWANTWICVVFKMLVDESHRYPRVWGNQWPHCCINYTLICFFSPINACILRFLSYK